MQVYLLESVSRVLMQEKLNELIKNDHICMIDANQQSLEEILTEASYVSMFEEMKYVVVKNAEQLFQKISKDDEGHFLAYLEQPYPLSTLILCSFEKVDSRKKIIKMIKEKYQYIVIPELKGLDLQKKIEQNLKGYKADISIVKYLMNALQNNYDLIVQEIEKLMIYYDKDNMMKYDEVIKIVNPLLNDNNFKLVDAVIQKKEELAFQLLEELYRFKVDPSSLLNLLTREIRLMLYVTLMEEEKVSTNLIKTELKLQDWQLKKIIMNKNRYREKDLKNLLCMLGDIDFKIKSGQADRYLELKIFILQLLEC